VSFAVGFRVAHFVVQSFLEGFPPRRDAGQRADPVHHTENIDADVERFGFECQRRPYHVAAVGTADDADTAAVDPVERCQVALRADDILEVHVAVTPVVHVEERLAVAG